MKTNEQKEKYEKPEAEKRQFDVSNNLMSDVVTNRFPGESIGSLTTNDDY